MNKENKIKYDSSVNDLLENIKVNYNEWTSWEKGKVDFANGLSVKSGRKFDKVLNGSSVWGFIAKENGEFKGIPHKKGDVFKAASWRGPAKWARGSIFDSNTNWFRWTGPNYL